VFLKATLSSGLNHLVRSDPKSRDTIPAFRSGETQLHHGNDARPDRGKEQERSSAKSDQIDECFCSPTLLEDALSAHI
jgi:hypothetical protein